MPKHGNWHLGWSIPWLCLLFQLASCQFNLYHSAVSLDDAAFNTTFGTMDPDALALVEFYASWCPACKYFAPEFEQIAIFFSKRKVAGQQLFVARVDCAKEIKLCSVFDVQGYPSVYVGKAKPFFERKVKEVHTYPDEKDREPKEIVAWVGEVLHSPLTYDGPSVEEIHKGLKTDWGEGEEPDIVESNSTSQVWDIRDVEGATIQQFQIISTSPLLVRGHEKRQALQALLGYWATAHPSTRCRTASSQLLHKVDALWPPHTESASDALQRYPICGPSPHWTGDWVMCKGSKPDMRGFSCGLWTLKHTSVHRLPEATAAGSLMMYLHTFAEHFFQCDVCRKHFSKLLTGKEAGAVKTKKEAALWLWWAHNQVNARLAETEEKYGHSVTGDPAFPKRQWPTPEMCPDCWPATSAVAKVANTTVPEPEWNKDAVYGFLERTYGSVEHGMMGLDNQALSSAAAKVEAATNAWWSNVLFFAILLIAILCAVGRTGLPLPALPSLTAGRLKKLLMQPPK